MAQERTALGFPAELELPGRQADQWRKREPEQAIEPFAA
jgi:hypothetical protein